MYIRVRLLKGWTEPLLYTLPTHLEAHAYAGMLVRVPLRTATELAWVEEVNVTPEDGITYTIREALAIHKISEDTQYQEFVTKLAAYYALEPLTLYKRIHHFLEEHGTVEALFDFDHNEQTSSITLTDEQEAAVAAIVPYLHTKDKILNQVQGDTSSIYFKPFVLHGVTGSGKTEVYAQLVAHAAARGRSTLILLPEVSLAVRFSHIFTQKCAHLLPVVSLHSATSAPEKRRVIQLMSQEKPILVIGVHMPVFLPLPTLGIIIIDEEHDPTYQMKKNPKIHMREAALIRAQVQGIPIVLGSATPSISTLHNIKVRGWQLLKLTKRFAGAFPTIRVTKIDPKEKREHFWITKELEAALYDRLERKEQSIIFLNRRGHSFFMQCKGCSHIFTCTQCSVSLTFHEPHMLLCHYCGNKKQAPQACPTCAKKEFLKKGVGTQQMVGILQKIFPQARIERADLDTTVNKKRWQETLQSFAHGEIDILVGTQTITKGYHFPNVTLVGIIWADMHLSIPSYMATETTLQQLIQVAGRAGRERAQSEVIIQTMISHPLYTYIDEGKYPEFYAYEITQRSLVQYPPLIRFAELELRHTDETILDNEADWCMQLLEQTKNRDGRAVTVLGPAIPPVAKIKNIFSRKIYCKAAQMTDIIALYLELRAAHFSSTLHFTPNPLSL